MQRYNGQLLNQFPNTVTGISAAGAKITVRVKSTGALATLYANNSTSGATLSNPLTADSKGYYGFYAPDGVYTLDVSLSGTPQLEIQLQDVASLQSQFNNAVSNAGYIPVGTFAAGCTVSQANGVVSDGVSYWRWDGSLPKTVTAGSSPTPVGVGGWFLTSDGAFESELAAAGSQKLIAGVKAADLAGKRRVDIREFGIVFDGTDEGAKLRTALASGSPLYFPPNKTIVVGVDPASAFNDGGVTRYTRCIGIPSNADLMFAPNFTIKGANGLQSWTRVITMENVNGIKIYGTMKVDANVQNRGAQTNEHMHGVFMYNVTNLEADTIHSINARGDNVFIGGDNETTFSDKIRIRSVFGEAAGRKNLVIHMVDNLYIDYANLNNEGGGASLYGGTADDSDKHCLDVEPDAFTGSRIFRQYIGELRTRGQGNDFTAGTTPAQADQWVLTIGNMYHRNTGSSAVRTWIHYGMTVNILGDMELIDCFGADETVYLLYAARLNVAGRIKINGSCPTANKAMIAAYASGGNANTPSIKAREIEVSCSQGGGLFLRSCHLDVGTLRTACPAYAFISGDNVSVAANKAIVKIDRLVTNNTGGTYVGYLDTPVTASPYMTIGEIIITDTRTTKASAIFQLDSGNSLNFVLGEISESSGIPLAAWLGSDKYLKSSAYRYICQGTPLNMIAAPVGSIASRIDGGAGTSFYVKESGTGNTGWVAK